LHRLITVTGQEFLSAGISLLLYIAILLRVRGNLTKDTSGRWRLRFIPSSEAWQLALARDILDSASLGLAQAIILYPLAYSGLLVPITITRFAQFAGKTVPSWAVVTTAVIFNLTGLVDALLLLVIRRVMPDTTALPALTTKREKVELGKEGAKTVTPFDLSEPIEPLQRTTSGRSTASVRTVDSHAPLTSSSTENPV
jgi:hypothetical protein